MGWIIPRTRIPFLSNTNIKYSIVSATLNLCWTQIHFHWQIIRLEWWCSLYLGLEGGSVSHLILLIASPFSPLKTSVVLAKSALQCLLSLSTNTDISLRHNAFPSESFSRVSFLLIYDWVIFTTYIFTNIIHFVCILSLKYH